MSNVAISIGTNLGKREHNISTAIENLQFCCGKVIKQSALYETEPWGFKSRDLFLNQVIVLVTEMEPEILMQQLLQIENSMGRERSSGSNYSSRLIDLDILFYDDRIINTEMLVIPHPRLHERNFILMPAAEIIPEFLHPVLRKSIAQLQLECPDKQKVVKYS